MPDALDPDSGEVVYGGMRWNTPLSGDHAELLLDRLAVGDDDVLDLGCGWGQLLIRAVHRAAGARGTGVDTSAWALEQGRGLAAERGVGARIRFIEGDASAWSTPADRVLCIGASHAWGGSADALAALRRLVRPGGRLLFGDGFWERERTSAAVSLFGEGVPTLGGLVDQAVAGGWRLLHMSTADQREWDDFESTWRAGRETWLLANPDHDRAAEIRTFLERRLREYLDVYRGVLGFAYLVLAPQPSG